MAHSNIKAMDSLAKVEQHPPATHRLLPTFIIFSSLLKAQSLLMQQEILGQVPKYTTAATLFLICSTT